MNYWASAVYDVTRPETLENLGHWLEEVKLYCRDGGKNVVKLLVGNKVDIVSAKIRKGKEI